MGAYVHNSAKGGGGAVGKQAAVVALEGAPTAASEEAQQLADRLAMHVVAMRPKFLNRGSGVTALTTFSETPCRAALVT